MADEPIATGTLAKTPLSHLLIYLDQKQLSGTLALWPDVQPEGENRQDRILLLKGKPVAARLIEPAKTLREGMLKLFFRSQAPYAFYDGNLLGEASERLNGRLDALSLITESLRSTARDDLVDEMLQRLGDGTRLRMQPKVELARFELVPEERSVVELLMAEPATVDTLSDGSGMPAARVRRLLYLLLITKAVAPYEKGMSDRPRSMTPPSAARSDPPAGGQSNSAHPSTPPPRVPSDHPPAGADASGTPASASSTSSSPQARADKLSEIPAPPDNLSAEHRDRWQKIATRARLIENQNYFEMLSLDKKATSSEAKTEFFKLAKDWHPDRLPAELAALRPFAEIIFAYMNEAQKALSDEEQRVAYVRTVREGGGTPASERLMQSILDSALSYERVQVFARRHQYDDALELLHKILTITKDEPDYHAMNAWLLMQKFPGADAPSAKILEALDKAIELYGDHEKAHSHKAEMLKRLGRQNEAMRHYKKVVSINPNNVEAARQVRIAQMREEKLNTGAPKSAAAGLFNKFLGGDKKKK